MNKLEHFLRFYKVHQANQASTAVGDIPHKSHGHRKQDHKQHHHSDGQCEDHGMECFDVGVKSRFDGHQLRADGGHIISGAYMEEVKWLLQGFQAKSLNEEYKKGKK